MRILGLSHSLVDKSIIMKLSEVELEKVKRYVRRYELIGLRKVEKKLGKTLKSFSVS